MTINQYCKDSGDYIERLMAWKNNELEEECEYRLVALDVKNLYPSFSRELIKLALQDSLNTCSNLTLNGKETVTELILFCLDNIIVQFKDQIYKQTTGIATGDNHSVSLANIGIHYIIRKITEINDYTILFMRFIDDIIYIKKDDEDNDKIKLRLNQEFEKYGLQLTFREASTKEEDKGVEFLDVFHQIQRSEKKKFVIKNYVKPTATKAKFLNGRSYHPPYIYKGIITGETKRLSRLNEKDDDFLTSMKNLKNKCERSSFNRNLVEENFKTAEIQNYCKSRKETTVQDQNEKNTMIPWATNFKSILRLNKEEQNLKKTAMITYTRPPTISKLVTNYKNISKNQDKNQNNKCGSSKPCGKCALCGNFKNYTNMVKTTNIIKSKEGKTYKLIQQLDCKSYGVYVAQCEVCGECYVGQTITPFHLRWNQHRATWKKMTKLQNYKVDKDNNDDEVALFHHYKENHKDDLCTEEKKTPGKCI